ncbi:GntR family transcriptional regulator [Streptomyces sp. NPDC047315]|uniref:GntR family transcriptional regulator n=1 Tax=Streptomyces sp. NPDC047315 TaxID=3155142 RepID=UPI0033E9F28A
MGDSPSKRIGYRQIADTLLTQIEGGELRPGDSLPSEAKLAVQFSVTRATARKAVEHLAARELVAPVQGRGWFVREPEGGTSPATKHAHLAEELRSRIRRGALKPGDPLPSEAALSTEFQVSRTTVRNAVSELERQGFTRREGRGRVVATPTNYGDDGDRSSAWIVHGEEPIYENYWVTVNRADIQTPDGERFDHHKVYLPPAAMAAMVDVDRVYMKWRHRFVSDRWNWELPGGVVDPGEDPKETAAREILEETGYRPLGELEHVVTFEPMIGTVSSPHYVYVARGVEYVAPPTEVNEGQRAEWIPLDEIPKLISDGLIANSGALVALLHLLSERASR